MRHSLALAFALAVACGPQPDTSGDPGDQGMDLWHYSPEPSPQRTTCTTSETAAALADTDEPLVLRCNLTLQETDTVRRRIVLAGAESSGVTVRCNGATLHGPTPAVSIRSDCGDPAACVPVHDVMLDGCTVRGSIYVFGLAINGNGEALLRTHDTIEHISVVRGAAPYRVTLRGLDVIGNGPVPVYLGPGVHDSTIEDTSIRGRSQSVMLYLDAESTANRLVGLDVDSTRGQREAIAFDGSSDNVLRDSNVFGAIDGLKLYRNCGEAGVSRHTTPSGNLIANNVWGVAGYCITFGARGGHQGYCALDRDSQFGSGQDDRDWARDNVARANYCRVRVGDETNRGNEVTN